MFLDKNFLIGVYSEPSRASRMELSAYGFEWLIVFQKGMLSGIFSGGSEYNSGLTNDFLFLFFIPQNVSFKSACKYLWQKLVLCGKESIHLQNKLIGWFLYGLGFCWRYFQADYSIVLISETAIAKYPFVFHNCGDFILVVFQTFSLQFYLRAPLWMFLYSFFFCTYSTGAHFDDFFR